MRLDRPYIDRVASGVKTVEIRVLDKKRSGIRVGDLVVFANGETELPMTVEAVNVYESFPDAYRAEDPASINPSMSVNDQIVGLREMYPPEREALGVVALHLTDGNGARSG